MLKLTECKFPNMTPLSAQHYGCKCVRCKEAKKLAQRKYRLKYPERTKKAAHDWVVQSKLCAFEAYGGAICNCCGENNLDFLSLDHVFNDGYLDHNKNKVRCAGSALYSKLRRLGYPDKQRFQVLCMNCNFGKKINHGICPHKSK